jgi:O-antigen/teichoic acid export membrane protein
MALQAVSSLLVARILIPRSYGIFGLALTLVGALRYVGDFGVTYRLEVLRRADKEDVSRALAIGLLTAAIGGLLVSVIWQLLPVVDEGPPGSRLVAPVLALTLLITAPMKPAMSILHRRLEFRAIANSSLLASVVLFVVQIGLLLAGWGIWAMVTAYVISSTVNVVYLVSAAGKPPMPRLHRPALPVIRLSVPYQAPLVAQAAVGLIVPLVVSWLLGARGVGYLTWSTILATPVIYLVFQLEAVVCPSLARMLRDDGAQYTQATSVVLLTFATLSAAASGALIGLVPPIIRFVFGARWLPATGAVQLAVIGIIPTSLVAACASVVNSQDRPGSRVKASVAAAATALTLTAPITLLAGVTGAAAVAYLISPVAEVVVLASQAGARLTHLCGRIARTAVPLAAVSLVLGHLSTSRAALAASLVILPVASFLVLATTERALVQSLWRKIRPQPTVAH